MFDRIILNNCKFMANIGCTHEERIKKQDIFIDVELFFSTRKAAKSDDLGDAMDYCEIHSLMKEVIDNNSLNLIEALAEKISDKILLALNVEKLLLTLKKPHALEEKGVSHVAVSIQRP